MTKLSRILAHLHTPVDVSQLPGMARFGIQAGSGRAISTRGTCAVVPAATCSIKHTPPGRAGHYHGIFLLRKTFSHFTDGRINSHI